MHNKPGMRPLDDKTKSGKLVERIAKQVRSKSNEVVKTNLFNVDHYPKAHEISTLAFDWIERVELYQHDIVVLLGACVHKHFPKLPALKKIEIAHPSSKWSHADMDAYVIRSVALIKAAEQQIKSLPATND